jgi:hypothetical protein
VPTPQIHPLLPAALMVLLFIIIISVIFLIAWLRT